VNVDVSESKQAMGARAARAGGTLIRDALALRNRANLILATGSSQFEMLEELAREPGIDWSRVTVFHLDEYVGMLETHPASFRRYLRERFLARLPAPVGTFHAIAAEVNPEAECVRLAALIAAIDIDVAFVGIGENGHLAFNDPPADFAAEVPYLVVRLDEACRRQQLGEGWFATLAEVPTRAISMSIRQILRAASIICTVPDARKAEAVRGAVEGPVTPDLPASALQRHPHCRLFLDAPAASLLRTR
jgi:glucosamine-6-phosphate deaminase